jgi:NAD(P)H-dependent flavin oxidoreductase YrpB (nitropropane dioxygenase family)
MNSNPVIIQGGLGAGISNWRLAHAVSQLGQLGVVSGTALDQIFARRLQDGDTVRLKSRYGEATVQCRTEDLPEGMAFMAFGSTINQLMGSETYSTGMPDTKGIEIELEKSQA